MSFVLPLAPARPFWRRGAPGANGAARELVGGKAVGLELLRGLGLRVPDGFVLTTLAFEAFAARAGLDEALRDLVEAMTGVEALTGAPGSGAPPSAPLSDEELRARCEALQARVRAAPLPDDILAALEAALAGLGGPYAVRSSATLEDGRTTSFAGVFASRLGVAAADVPDAVRDAWASLYGVEALTHALRCGIDPRGARMAVLVQELVEPERAGALFTREPSGATPDEALLAWTLGRGDALMDGAASGRSLRVCLRAGGPAEGERLDPPGEDALPPALLERLLAAGRLVEEAAGHPQDIEWAARGDALWLLQARPITTLDSPRAREIVWTRELSEERFPRPISPLGWSVLDELLPANTRTLRRRFGLTARDPRDVARTIDHYVYSNEGFFQIPGSMRLNPLAQARHFAAYGRELLDAARHLPATLGAQAPFGPRWLLTTRLFRAFVFPHAREVERSWRRHLAGLLAEMDAYDALDPTPLRDRALWEHKQAMLRTGLRYMEPDLAIYVVKMACSWMIERIGAALNDGAPDPDFLCGLTAGVDNRTLAMNVEFAALSRAIGAAPALRALLGEGDLAGLAARLTATHAPDASDAEEAEEAEEAEAAAAFAGFQARNGHNTTNWDLMQATWGEDPAQVLALLRGHAAAGASEGFLAHRAAQVAARERAEAAAAARLRGAPWMVPFFRQVLRTLHAFMAIDEEHHFYCSRLYRPMRRTILELGRRLASRGVLDAPEDVFFLTFPEARQALASRSALPRRHLARARRASFERALARRPPDRYRGQAPLAARGAEGAGEPPADLPDDVPDGALVGRGASPGVAEGAVRLVLEPADAAAFQPGEVLVVQSPNPVWTPLYGLAAALVAGTGSPLSHGLVSAREYRLPAVIGISDVTSKLATGQRVRVDGSQGIVAPAP